MQAEAAAAHAAHAIPIAVLNRDADLVKHALLEIGIHALARQTLHDHAEQNAVAGVI